MPCSNNIAWYAPTALLLIFYVSEPSLPKQVWIYLVTVSCPQWHAHSDTVAWSQHWRIYKKAWSSARSYEWNRTPLPPTPTQSSPLQRSLGFTGSWSELRKGHCLQDIHRQLCHLKVCELPSSRVVFSFSSAHCTPSRISSKQQLLCTNGISS